MLIASVIYGKPFGDVVSIEAMMNMFCCRKSEIEILPTLPWNMAIPVVNFSK